MRNTFLPQGQKNNFTSSFQVTSSVVTFTSHKKSDICRYIHAFKKMKRVRISVVYKFLIIVYCITEILYGIQHIQRKEAVLNFLASELIECHNESFLICKM